MIITKKICYVVLLFLISNLTVQAQKKQANGMDTTDTISPSKIAKQLLSPPKKQPKEIHGYGVQPFSMHFQV